MSGVYETVSAIKKAKIVAIARGLDEGQIRPVAKALIAGGIKAMEVTFNTPGAPKMIEILSNEFSSELLVGAGTVLDPKTAATAASCGAKFVLSPVTDISVINECKRLGVVSVPGAMTPTEIFAAWQAGAGMVKVFPAGTLGPKYIADLLAPLNDLSLMAVGGISLENVARFFSFGAHAVGIGSDLLNKRMIASGDYSALERQAALFTAAAAKPERT
ncbi:MAG: bifunctional 4-hydroxy-2-oxoglutarate aldolase/2-dehydro-3-deoxy-phosphogluconate aldolase [Christensenellales bacterium]